VADAKGKPAMARINASVSSDSASAIAAPTPPSRVTPYAPRHKLADHFIGGNRLGNAVAGPVKDFVISHDGHTVITNVSKKGERRKEKGLKGKLLTRPEPAGAPKSPAP
jgi:hypothetical protein